MKSTIIVLAIFGLLLVGCTGVTGNAARPPPPAPSGGGCGVAAPVDVPATPVVSSVAEGNVRAPAL
ncbi:hypothetical protein HY490_04360 [Candidatus Woesearchaeota archaeon]|nr:hypothetical protein [Candidatus Woesearchaeota archaeon]